ncbi:hypothetical protein [Streptomyces sp. NPDC055189]
MHPADSSAATSPDTALGRLVAAFDGVVVRADPRAAEVGGAIIAEPGDARLLVQPRGSARRCGGPLIVTALAETYSPAVGGWFMSGMALLSLLCVLALPEAKERDLDHV